MSNVIVGAGVVEAEEGVMVGVSTATAFETCIRAGDIGDGEPIVLRGNRMEDVPVALRVAVLWLKHSLPEIWTRMRCPGPLITDAYGGELPPMLIEAQPLSQPKRGMSMTLALALSMVSCLTGCPARKRVGVTGSMDISGRLWDVDAVTSKAVAMQEAGVKTVIVAFGSKHDSLVSGLKYEVCKHIFEALPLALEPHDQGPPAG